MSSWLVRYADSGRCYRFLEFFSHEAQASVAVDVRLQMFTALFERQPALNDATLRTNWVQMISTGKSSLIDLDRFRECVVLVMA